MAKCPNCDAKIAWDVSRCSACFAAFDGEAAWRPVPESPDEEQNLSRKHSARQAHEPAQQAPELAQQAPEPLISRTGNALWLAFKLCLSVLLLLVALFSGVVAMRSPFDWGMTGFAGVLLFFAAVLWIDYTKPSRAVGLAGIVVAIGLGLMARNISTGGAVFPRKCTGRSWWLCELENELYSVGGPDAVAAVWIFFALLVLYGSYVAIARSRAPGKPPRPPGASGGPTKLLS